MNDNLKVKDIILKALKEDKETYDVTSEWLFDNQERSRARLIAKEEGILSGIDVFKDVFKVIDDSIVVSSALKEGESITKGQVIAEIEGSTKGILYGERTALNILQRMCGIATLTNACVKEVQNTKVKIVDTRKTAPGLRILDKIAVRAGGGFNHRFNLSDGVLIKDNHIKACGSISEAIKRVKSHAPHTLKVEIEVESVSEFLEAMNAKADIVMLDNMTLEDMKECVRLNQSNCTLEASGNMKLDRLHAVAGTGVDVISIGGLTHSVKALDISLRFE
ncbi:carboxylating nicotinate-nucleotide diphosphorylase [Fusibacter bizertensis]|uniref:nicotinate-nucleotide diphosphorylase (carboxylating) n=1 Tax=Fusibacter bizertensis TaxID=1488331 RepID=A0ABT6NDQ6_9FIRM|nr:carboxylating nicotinate-nucleotide diphosphorylase [Fusibacter bizertensis]MDH8678564.1 carboxylating nicotinate-nucleotide diphosphorylase [Fusibacter bizertensis]